jgi:hypothetical protein
LPDSVEHLVVQLGIDFPTFYSAHPDKKLGIPIAYPRMVFLETALDSKLNPLVAIGKTGSLGLSGFVNKFNSEAELLDDLVRLLSHMQVLISINWYNRTTIGLLVAIRSFALSSCSCFLPSGYFTERTKLAD